ncbi:MAG: hypothetical protein ABGX07_04140 [Pirellulaceae bacterium]
MWKNAGSTIQWHSGSVRGTFSPSQPAMGLRLDRSEGLLFGLTLDGQHIPAGDEHYIRGTDLYVDCPSDDRLVRIQSYYRDLVGPVPGIELVISVQTTELDISTNLQVATRLPGHLRQERGGNESCIDRENNVFQWCDDDARVSGILFVHPSDFVTAQSDGQTLVCDLFPEPMEHGVIRRGRLRCYVAPEDATVERLYQEFLDAPLPLTT